MKKLYTLDGSRFSTLEEFYDEVGRVLAPEITWGRNLDAFNDLLRGEFGTPDNGFILRWKGADLSRNTLGYLETVRQLRIRLENCHPANRGEILTQIRAAEKSNGPTVFDWLVAIIRRHEKSGEEPASGVELELT